MFSHCRNVPVAEMGRRHFGNAPLLAAPCGCAGGDDPEPVPRWTGGFSREQKWPVLLLIRANRTQLRCWRAVPGHPLELKTSTNKNPWPQGSSLPPVSPPPPERWQNGGVTARSLTELHVHGDILPSVCVLVQGGSRASRWPDQRSVGKCTREVILEDSEHSSL